MSSELIPVSVALSDQEYFSPLGAMLMHRRLPPALNSSIRREVFTSSCLFKFLYNAKQYFLPLQMQNLESLIVL